mgnify:CR=1 FL=1
MKALHDCLFFLPLLTLKTGVYEFFAIDPLSIFLSNLIMDLETATLFRITFSLGGLLIFLCLGFLLPYRKSQLLKNKSRLLTNISISFFNGAFLYFLLPFTLVGISFFAKEHQLGLFHYLSLPTFYQTIIEVILLDFIIYWQHRLTHTIPFLWLFHRVHHSDTEFDTTTAGRFHFIETLFSFFIKALFTILFGFSALSLVLFEIILNFSSLFNHSNFSLPGPIERITRFFIVTPDMHRIHHSTIVKETNSNYGFCITLWDKIFKSYLHEPKNNPKHMDIGLHYFRSPRHRNFFYLLKMPFLKKE